MAPTPSAAARAFPAAGSATVPFGVVPTDDETVRVAPEAYTRLAQLWSLTDREAAGLLDLTTRTWQRIKHGRWNGERLGRDQLLRVGALVAIHRALPRCFGAEIAAAWPRLANSSAPFAGRSPVQFMVDGALPALMHVRLRVEAMVQGA